jgi:hypothetical protein
MKRKSLWWRRAFWPTDTQPRAILPALDEEYRADRAKVRIGVAFSGGGIRSAAFSLGALQALQEKEIFPNVEYVAAVSGGNYIASAFTISAALSDPSALGGDNKQPWARGSVEEHHLRHNTDYLAPGITGRLWLLANIVYGFTANYLPFALSAFILGRIAGWLLNWAIGPDVGETIWTTDARQTQLILLGCAGALTIGALAAVFWRRRADGRSPVDAPHNPAGNRSTQLEDFERRAGIAFGLGVGSLLVFTLGPGFILLYRNTSAWVVDKLFGADASAFSDESFTRITIASLWLLVALLLAGVALSMSRQSRARGTMLMSAAVGASGMLVIPFLSSFEYASSRGLKTARDLLGPTVAVVLIGLMAVFVHNRRYSMHLFYRERLCKIFAVARTDDGGVSPLNYKYRVRFSEVGKRLAERERSEDFPHVPKLVICCAVNVSSHDAPIGRNAGSFTFESDYSGSPLLGYAETSKFEKEGPIHGTDLTLPSLMAISGAALSPMMGRLTNPAVRFLMALTNVRLGVWIPSKWLQRGARAEQLDGTASPPDDSPSKSPAFWRRQRNKVVAGWYEPGALYVLREALGIPGRRHPSTRKDREFVYVSDGGHFENLGLVELVRRRCTHILCFDASLDSAGEALDIGRAIALARADLHADIDLDPSPTMSNTDGVSESMVASGSVTYPDQTQAALILTRAVLTAGATWDVRSFEKRDRRFPKHSTRQQLFTDEQFQAYRTLGYQGGVAAVQRLNLPPVILKAAGGTASPDHKPSEPVAAAAPHSPNRTGRRPT